MTNQPNYYAIIPANVRYCKALEPAARLFYGELTALTSKEGYCWASNAYFADLYDVDERTITRWLSSLEDLGFIEIETKKNGMKWERKIYIIKEKFTKGQKCTDREDKNVYKRAINKSNNTKEAIEEKTTSLSLNSCSFDTASFSPETFKLANGNLLTARTVNSFRKYLETDREKLLSNIEFYLKKCEGGYQPDSHERYLQFCINNDLASVERNHSQNLLYAKFLQADKVLHSQMKILKTVIQLSKKEGREPISISLNLLHSQFCQVIDEFLNNYID